MCTGFGNDSVICKYLIRKDYLAVGASSHYLRTQVLIKHGFNREAQLKHGTKGLTRAAEMGRLGNKPLRA